MGQLLADNHFADPLGGLTEQQWDGLAGDRFYSSAFWLRLCALEGGGASGAVPVELPGGGLAAVPVIAVGQQPHPNCRWGDRLAARGLPSPPAQGLLIGQRRGYLAHLLARPDADPGTVADALLAAVRAVRPPAPVVDDGARVALFLTTPDVLALRAAGVRSSPVLLAADAWIEIPDGGWDGWLDNQRSSHRARRIRSEARRFVEAGYRVWQRPLAQAYPDVARLTVQTEHRYGKPADQDRYAEAFRLQGEFAGPRAQVLFCGYDDGPAVGCCLYYRAGDTIYLRAVGFDYPRLRGAAEYFNLTYYLPAQLPGVRWLHAGISTPDGKALRGAQLRPLWLLDLSADSVLTDAAEQVRAHNAAFRAELANSSPAVAAALEPELWNSLD